MSRFHGPQGQGALAALRDRRRVEAEDRQSRCPEARTGAQGSAEDAAPEAAMPEPASGSHTMCACGKRGYASKRAALAANATNSKRLRAYQHDSGLWHVTRDAYDPLSRDAPGTRKAAGDD